MQSINNFYYRHLKLALARSDQNRTHLARAKIRTRKTFEDIGVAQQQEAGSDSPDNKREESEQRGGSQRWRIL